MQADLDVQLQLAVAFLSGLQLEPPVCERRKEDEERINASLKGEGVTLGCNTVIPTRQPNTASTKTARAPFLLYSVEPPFLLTAHDDVMARRLSSYFFPGFFLALGRSSRAVEASIPRMVE